MKSNSQMNRTIFFILLMITTVLVSCNRPKKQPNIVFFLVDDLGWTDVGCYGSSLYDTPNIDALSETGVRFTDAYAACHVCSPTRASILCGKYPTTINLTDWLPGRREFPFQRLSNVVINQHLPYEEITIAEALKEVGYRTAIIGKWHLGEDPSNPMAHGFDMHIPNNWPWGWPKSSYFGPFDLEGLEDSKKGDYLTDRLTDEALRYMEENKDHPFFLYMSHYAVHDPIQGRKDLVKKYSGVLNETKGDNGPDYILEGNPDNPDNPSFEELKDLSNTPEYAPYKILPNGIVKIKQKQDNVEFAGMVESMDESLGRIVDKLKKLGIEDHTIIFFYSDNGGMAAANLGNPRRVFPGDKLDMYYSTSNLPLRGAKGWLYEGGIRVPLIIKWPGKGKQGIECSVPVTSVDMFPTIMSMLDLDEKISRDKEGVDISPLVKGEIMERGPIFWHFPHYSNHGMQSPGGAVRDGDYKLIEYFENGSVQLFNLKNDIGEQNDLSGNKVLKTRELIEKLHNWRIQTGAQMMLPNPDYNASIRAENY
jgi:arylsulfatase A-like enzyme